ncbi:ribonuclease E inhibitor RraB [Agarivorans sp. MS3-6]|uniref:ribonuclease E inhibitor RraB n=1 Tax=Agarivorans sp. TSD2052 TaxID=2937286 RepID=UPI00200C9CAC|nr:ribonuclease E inhibitor RraB [Agarivorans sp. TSD2052]UPW19398.1 ribonuclease E inhibitor RraB [Agarivorans sp. TSD2052]
MSTKQLIADWQTETDLIIQELLADGSDPDAEYTIEHHIACKDFKILEKAAVDVFKAGYEVSDAEEAEWEDGDKVWCFDVIVEAPLDAAGIKQDIESLANIAEKNKVTYDGWGTYFESDEDEEQED